MLFTWAICLLPLGVCAQSLMLEIPLADGTIRQFPMIDGEILPARSDRSEMIVAGAVTQPNAEDNLAMDLRWAFVVATKLRDLARVRITEVSRDPQVRLVDDREPVLDEDGVYRVALPPLEIREENWPWLFRKERSVFVFRVELISRNLEDDTLYQLNVFSAEEKMNIRMLNGKL